MIQPDPTSEHIEAFLSKYPKAGATVLSVLGKQKPFIDALHTSAGIEILSSLTSRMEDVLPKIINLEAKDEEIIEYRILKSIGIEWARKIASYNENVLKVKENRIERTRKADK